MASVATSSAPKPRTVNISGRGTRWRCSPTAATNQISGTARAALNPPQDTHSSHAAVQVAATSSDKPTKPATRYTPYSVAWNRGYCWYSG